jgi:hypothetical protein
MMTKPKPTSAPLLSIVSTAIVICALEAFSRHEASGQSNKRVGQRPVIKIESPDRHVFELYFTPPGEREWLVARAPYTRRRMN